MVFAAQRLRNVRCHRVHGKCVKSFRLQGRDKWMCVATMERLLYRLEVGKLSAETRDCAVGQRPASGRTRGGRWSRDRQVLSAVGAELSVVCSLSGSGHWQAYLVRFFLGENDAYSTHSPDCDAAGSDAAQDRAAPHETTRHPPAQHPQPQPQVFVCVV